jgi:dTMP kinase
MADPPHAATPQRAQGQAPPLERRGDGRFISLEGGEGAGKSTQIRHLAQALQAAGKTVVTTREPGGAPGAEAIRTLLVGGDTGRWDGVTELLLHYAARRDHLVHTVLPALARGDWVVTDRFADSTMAYQGYGFGLGRAAVEQVHQAAIGDIRPDLTLILDIPVEAGLARAAKRDGEGAAAGNGGANRYERMPRDFHERLRQGFLDIAAREPARCVVIDAGRPAAEVARAIRAVVAERLGIALPDRAA